MSVASSRPGDAIDGGFARGKGCAGAIRVEMRAFASDFDVPGDAHSLQQSESLSWIRSSIELLDAREPLGRHLCVMRDLRDLMDGRSREIAWNVRQAYELDCKVDESRCRIDRRHHDSVVARGRATHVVRRLDQPALDWNFIIGVAPGHFGRAGSKPVVQPNSIATATRLPECHDRASRFLGRMSSRNQPAEISRRPNRDALINDDEAALLELCHVSKGPDRRQKHAGDEGEEQEQGKQIHGLPA